MSATPSAPPHAATRQQQAEAPAIGWSFLASKRWVGYYALFLIFSVSCVLLGNWQFDRRAEARAEIERIDANYSAASVPLETALDDLGSYDDDAHKWQTVSAEGQYLDEVYLARNRPGAGSVGSDLLQGFETRQGSVIFVDRGWVDVDAVDVDEAAALPAGPSGTTAIEVRLRASEDEIDGRTISGHSVARINTEELAQLAGTEGRTYTSAYGMLVDEAPGAEHGLLPPKPERDEGPHLSYALQWYVFILIAFSGLIYAARQEYRGLNAGSDTVRGQDRRRAERKRRKGPSDADEEDALLDA